MVSSLKNYTFVVVLSEETVLRGVIGSGKSQTLLVSTTEGQTLPRCLNHE